MTSQPDGTGVLLDVEALRRAAETLRTAAPALADVTVTAGRAVGEAAPAAGAPTLGRALGDFARRWAEGVASVAGRVDGDGALLRATVEAHVADEAAAAASFGVAPR